MSRSEAREDGNLRRTSCLCFRFSVVDIYFCFNMSSMKNKRFSTRLGSKIELHVDQEVNIKDCILTSN